MSAAASTTDHETIRQWVESRGACPAHVKGSGTRANPGILRIDYPGFSGRSSLEKISWKQFFDAFEANGLAFLYQDRRSSRFSKLVRRNGGSSGRTARAGHTREAHEELEVLGARLLEPHRELMKVEPQRELPRETRSAVALF